MSFGMDPVISSSDFGQVRAFVTVGETLSFSRAAETLGVSPSALSQLVRGFEARVGVRLFNRTTRSVSLTDAGERLFQRVRPAVVELGAAVGQVRRQGERPAGVVRVVSFHSAAELYLRPMLASFHAAYPEVVLDITLDDAVGDFVGQGFDVALRLGEVIEKDMVAVRLGPDLRQIAVASPDYLAHHGAPMTPRDLVDHRCIRWRWPGTTTPYHWEFWQDGGWFEVAVDGPLIVNSKALALDAALDGIGIAFAVDQRVERYVAEGRLVPLLEAWCAPFPGLFLGYPRQRQMAPALRAFIDHVRAAANVHTDG
jgi:DNA-binding transcriptional LysR family regulator